MPAVELALGLTAITGALINPATLSNCISKWDTLKCKDGEFKALLKTVTWTNCVCVGVNKENDSLQARPHLPSVGFHESMKMTLMKDNCFYNEESITNSSKSWTSMVGHKVRNTGTNTKIDWSLVTPDQTTFAQSLSKDLQVGQKEMYISPETIREVENKFQKLGEQMNCKNRPLADNISFKRAYEEHKSDFENSEDKLEELKKFPNHNYFIGAFGDFCCMKVEYGFCDSGVKVDSTIDRFVKNVANRDEFVKRILEQSAEFNKCWKETIETQWEKWEKDVYIQSGELQEHVLDAGGVRNTWRSIVHDYKPLSIPTKILVVVFSMIALLLHVILYTVGPLSTITAVVLSGIGAITALIGDHGAVLQTAAGAWSIAGLAMALGKPIHATIVLPALSAAACGNFDKHATQFAKVAMDGSMGFLKEHWHHGLQAISKNAVKLKNYLKQQVRVWKKDYDPENFKPASMELEKQMKETKVQPEQGSTHRKLRRRGL